MSGTGRRIVTTNSGGSNSGSISSRFSQIASSRSGSARGNSGGRTVILRPGAPRTNAVGRSSRGGGGRGGPRDRGGFRGRGGRGRGTSRSGRGRGKKPITKEELDAELDEYLLKDTAKAKEYLDNELDEYFKQRDSHAEADESAPAAEADESKPEEAQEAANGTS